MCACVHVRERSPSPRLNTGSDWYGLVRKDHTCFKLGVLHVNMFSYLSMQIHETQIRAHFFQVLSSAPNNVLSQEEKRGLQRNEISGPRVRIAPHAYTCICCNLTSSPGLTIRRLPISSLARIWMLLTLLDYININTFNIHTLNFFLITLVYILCLHLVFPS